MLTTRGRNRHIRQDLDAGRSSNKCRGGSAFASEHILERVVRSGVNACSSGNGRFLCCRIDKHDAPSCIDQCSRQIYGNRRYAYAGPAARDHDHRRSRRSGIRRQRRNAGDLSEFVSLIGHGGV